MLMLRFLLNKIFIILFIIFISGTEIMAGSHLAGYDSAIAAAEEAEEKVAAAEEALAAAEEKAAAAAEAVKAEEKSQVESSAALLGYEKYLIPKIKQTALIK